MQLLSTYNWKTFPGCTLYPLYIDYNGFPIKEDKPTIKLMYDNYKATVLILATNHHHLSNVGDGLVQIPSVVPLITVTLS